MTSRDFCFWLQGFFEINHGAQAVSLNATQLGTIRNHLAMVFEHEIDPSMGTANEQAALNDLHNRPPGVRC